MQPFQFSVLMWRVILSQSSGWPTNTVVAHVLDADVSVAMISWLALSLASVAKDEHDIHP